MDTRLALPFLVLVLAGCEQLGLNEAAKLAERKEADAKAVGGACRHAGRAIETCYELNPKFSKAAIYAGWREMDGYMRENNIQPVSPEGEPSQAAAPAETEPKPEAAAGAAQEAAPKPGAAPGAKPEEKKGVAAPEETAPPSGKFKKVAWPGRHAT